MRFQWSAMVLDRSHGKPKSGHEPQNRLRKLQDPKFVDSNRKMVRMEFPS